METVVQPQQQNWQVYQDALRLSRTRWVAWVQGTELSHKKPSGRQDLFPGNGQKDESPVYLNDVSAPSGFSTFFFLPLPFVSQITSLLLPSCKKKHPPYLCLGTPIYALLACVGWWSEVHPADQGPPSWVSQHSPVFEYHSCQNIALLITGWDSTYTLGRKYNCGETQ